MVHPKADVLAAKCYATQRSNQAPKLPSVCFDCVSCAQPNLIRTADVCLFPQDRYVTNYGPSYSVSAVPNTRQSALSAPSRKLLFPMHLRTLSMCVLQLRRQCDRLASSKTNVLRMFCEASIVKTFGTGESASAGKGGKNPPRLHDPVGYTCHAKPDLHHHASQGHRSSVSLTVVKRRARQKLQTDHHHAAHLQQAAAEAQ